jgi:hypothetical protein
MIPLQIMPKLTISSVQDMEINKKAKKMFEHFALLHCSAVNLALT